jgi:hypothetical protein
MTAITQAVTVQGAQVWNGVVSFARGIGEVLIMLNAAVRVASAIEARQEPDPADVRALGIQGTLPRSY